MSRFYGFPVFDLPVGAKLAMLSAMPMMEAQDALDRHGYSAFDPDTLFELVKQATGSTEEAEEARVERIRKDWKDKPDDDLDA